MPDKRIRPIVKLELPPQAAATAAGNRKDRRHRGDMGEEGAGAELEVQLLRANAEAQAFALQGSGRG